MELTGAEAQELLGGYALDALDGPERVAFERRMQRDPELAAAATDLLEAASLLGAADADSPPAYLAERTMSAALAVRPAGTPAGASDPVRVYREQLDELAALFSGLEPGDWQAHTITGWSVHELAAHLLAVEGYLSTILGVAAPSPELAFEVPEGTEHDHVAMTEPTIAERSGERPGQTVEAWHALVDANLEHLERLDAAALHDRYSFHGLDLSLRSLLGARTFEVWTHTDDIRRAVGRSLSAPAPNRLRFMSALAVGALPLGLMLAGIDDPGRTIRVVLTGPGGGEWTQPLTVGADPGPIDATLVADVVDFCRLASQRLTPAQLPHTVDGDAHTVRDALVGAQVFAA